MKTITSEHCTDTSTVFDVVVFLQSLNTNRCRSVVIRESLLDELPELWNYLF